MMMAGPRAESQMSRSSCPATTSQPALRPEGCSMAACVRASDVMPFSPLSGTGRHRSSGRLPTRKKEPECAASRSARIALLATHVLVCCCVTTERDSQPAKISFRLVDTDDPLGLLKDDFARDCAQRIPAASRTRRGLPLDIGDCPLRDNLPAVHDDDAGTNLLDFVQEVGAQDNRGALSRATFRISAMIWRCPAGSRPRVGSSRKITLGPLTRPGQRPAVASSRDCKSRSASDPGRPALPPLAGRTRSPVPAGRDGQTVARNTAETRHPTGASDTLRFPGARRFSAELRPVWCAECRRRERSARRRVDRR